MARILSSLAVFLVVAGTGSAALAAPGTASPPNEQLASSDGDLGRERGTPSLFGKKTETGGYAGLDVAYTRMFGQDGAVVGLQGALLVNRRLALGLAGYGWTNPQEGPVDASGEERSYQTAYLGGTLRYSFLTSSPVYFSVGSLFGGGAVQLARNGDRDREGVADEDSDAFALLQPDVTFHANLTRWMRLGITAGYRFTAGVDHFGFAESDVNGVVFGGQVQIGRF